MHGLIFETSIRGRGFGKGWREAEGEGGRRGPEDAGGAEGGPLIAPAPSMHTYSIICLYNMNIREPTLLRCTRGRAEAGAAGSYAII